MTSVPALKWACDYDTRESSQTPFGSYYVNRACSGFRWGYCFDEYHDEDNFGCDSIDEGKAAAQKDWAERTVEMFDEAVAPYIAGLRELRGCVLKAKGNFAVDDLKAQMALRTVNTLLSRRSS